MKRNIGLISGSGDKAFGKENIDALKANVATDDTCVFCVGDGVEELEVSAIEKQLEAMSQNGDKTTIIINMHGTVKNGQFYFINGNEYISSKELFSIIGSKFKDQPIDLLITSCHSGASLRDKDLLPQGSVVGVTSPADTYTHGSYVKNFINDLADVNDELTAYNLMKIYLCGLDSRIPPEITIVGKSGILKLDDSLLEKFRGRKIDISKVAGLLNGYMTQEEIESLVEKIVAAKSCYDILAKDYGKALNICLADQFGEQLTTLNTKPADAPPATTRKR